MTRTSQLCRLPEEDEHPLSNFVTRGVRPGDESIVAVETVLLLRFSIKSLIITRTSIVNKHIVVNANGIIKIKGSSVGSVGSSSFFCLMGLMFRLDKASGLKLILQSVGDIDRIMMTRMNSIDFW